jgi:hypothetical protein
MTRPRAKHLTPLALVLVLAGCGNAGPNAPPSVSSKLNDATSGISTACGNAYRVTAFPGDHRADLSKLEQSAGSSAETLASVYRRNPDWRYLGSSLRTVVQDSLSLLDSCGLHQTQMRLEQATSSTR